MSYIEAKAKYAQFGIDAEKAIQTLQNVCISVHC
jgi:L-rhamnose isomerase